MSFCGLKQAHLFLYCGGGGKKSKFISFIYIQIACHLNYYKMCQVKFVYTKMGLLIPITNCVQIVSHCIFQFISPIKRN